MTHFFSGLAFIIQLLEQSRNLKSIHWFQTVDYKYKNDMKNLNVQKWNTSKEDRKLQQTLSLTEKRIEAFHKVNKGLNYY